MNRNEFMDFFRNDEKLSQLSIDDRKEIFHSILLGSSDITKQTLDLLLVDYCVNNIEIIEAH